jgi:hypothetical protein
MQMTVAGDSWGMGLAESAGKEDPVELDIVELLRKKLC